MEVLGLPPAHDLVLDAAPERAAGLEREERPAPDLELRPFAVGVAGQRLLEPQAVIDVLLHVQREVEDFRLAESGTAQAAHDGREHAGNAPLMAGAQRAQSDEERLLAADPV